MQQSFGLEARPTPRGRRRTDAWYAALASEWITMARDYARFPGLRWAPPTELRLRRTLSWQSQFGRAFLGAVGTEGERVDEAAHVGRAVIAVGRQHGHLQRDQPSIDEIERPQRAAAIVGLLDAELAPVHAVDAAKRVHQQFLLVLKHISRLAEQNGAFTGARREIDHGHFVFDVVVD